MPKRKDITMSQRTRRWTAGLEALNAAAEKAAIPEILAAHGKLLDLDMIGYNRLRDASAVDAALWTAIDGDGFTSQIALNDVFAPVLEERLAAETAVDAINISDAPIYVGKNLVAYADALGLDLTDYERLSVEGRDNVDEALFDAKEIAPFDDEDVIADAFSDAVETELEDEAVAAVNEAAIKDMAGVLALYADVFDIEIGTGSDYARLSTEGKGVVHTALVGQSFSDADAVNTAFDSAVDDQLEVEALAAVNEAKDATEMGVALLGYADVLALDVGEDDAYGLLSPEKQAEVHGEVLSNRPESPGYADTTAVKVAFDAAVSTAGSE